MAEDITLPFRVVRGTKRLINKKFGQKNIRKPAQLNRAATAADQAPPSKELTQSELLETGQTPLAHARASVGGELKEASAVNLVTGSDGKLAEVVLTRGNATTTYKINTVDDWYNAAGDAIGMSKESVEQSKKVSGPILKALADFHSVPVDDYIKGVSPQIRSVPSLADDVVAVTSHGALATSLDWMKTFRKVASLVEFVKKTPELAINQADSFITLQHELAHIILEDVFAYSRQLGLSDNGSLIDLSKALKDQVLVRGSLTDTRFSQKEIDLLKSLSVEEIGALLEGKSPARLMRSLTEGGKNQEVLVGDLTSLLHEAGADLFAKYTLEVATGSRPAASVAKRAVFEGLDSATIWNSAARSLSESWKILKGAVDPQGIALAQTQGEQAVVNNFAQILEQITESSLSGKAPVKRLPVSQARQLAVTHARQTVDPKSHNVMLMAAHLYGGKGVAVQNYGARVLFDLDPERTGLLLSVSTGHYTPFGKSIIYHNEMESVLATINNKIDFDEYSFADVEAMRATLTEVATSSPNKLVTVMDISPAVRSNLEDIETIIAKNPNVPNIKKRLEDAAFVNEAGQPVVFFHGAALDFDKNFDHMQTNLFSNIMAPGLYMTDWDQAAMSYAIDRFLTSPSASPVGARIQAFYPLVSKDKVISMESVGLTDRIGANFIEGVYSNPKHTAYRQAALASASRYAKKSLLASQPLRVQSPSAIGLKQSGRELAANIEKLDLAVADISKLFGDRALTDSFSIFSEQVDYLLRVFVSSGDELFIASKDASGAYIDLPVNDESFSSIIDLFYSGGKYESDLLDEIFSEAAATAAFKQVEIEMASLAGRGITPSKEQVQAFKNLQAQDEVVQQARAISASSKSIGWDDWRNMSQDIPLTLERLIRDTHKTVATPYLWQMAKGSSLLGHKPVNAALIKDAVEFATQHLHSIRNREFIRDIQETYTSLSMAGLDSITSDARKLRAFALKELNVRYAEHNIEAITEIGGSVQGGVPHRVVALVGSNETINSNRVFVSPKTKKYARSAQPTGNKVMDGAPYEVVGAGRTGGVAHRAVYDIDAYTGTRLRPVKPVGGNFKGGEQKTYEFSRAGLADEGKSVPLALVSIHRKHKVGIKQSRQTGKPVEDGTGWVMHTKPLGGGADLTLAERQEIADQLLQAPFGWINIGKKKKNIRRVSAIDINTTFRGVTDRQRQIMSDIAAREPSSDEARAYYRKQNPKGGDIDDTVVQGELEVTPTSFGRTLEDATGSINALNDKGVKEAIDKKLVASPRAVEGPARASFDEILDMQRKTEQGLVIQSWHGTPRKIAANLTPSQLDYPKYFGENISNPVNKAEVDFVLTDTTGIYRNSDGTITLEGNAFIADRLVPRIQEIIDGEEYKTFRKQRDVEIAEARQRGSAIIQKAEDDAKLSKSNPKWISGAEKERRVGIGKKLTEAEPSGFKPLKIHPIEVQALLRTGEERLKDIVASKGQKKQTRHFDREGYLAAIKKLIGVETPYVGSIDELEIAAAAPRLAGMQGTKALEVAEVLSPHEVQFLWEALGLQTKARAVGPRTKLQILQDLFIQMFNLPRMLQLAADLGAILNQGGLAGLGATIKPVTTRRSLKMLAKGDLKTWYKSPDTWLYRSLGNSMLGMFSAGNYRKQMDAITQDANYTYLTTKTDIHISDIDGPLSGREEVFLGNIFNSVGNVFPETFRRNPFMQRVGRVASKGKFIGYPFKAGERFHTLYLNKMRYDMLNDYNKGLIHSGIPEARRIQALKSYANFLNKATGRGSLGKRLDEMAPELSAVLLAPRWMTSRFQVPFTVAKTFGKEALETMPKRFAKGENSQAALKDAKHYAKEMGLNPNDVIESSNSFTVKGYNGAHTSKQMSADLARTFGVLGGITGLLAMNGFDVETDWRKSSFLKISKGRINIDLTMGLGSVWRFMARAAYGVKERKTVSQAGIEFEADVLSQLGNFTRAKLSPLGASGAGLITGESYFGEDVGGREMFIPGQSLDYEDFLPLMVVQIKDAAEQMDGGITLAVIAAGAVSGLNMGIYPDKDDLAMELAGIPYKDLYGYEQKYINRMYYEGTEFQPSDYIRETTELEVEQYEFIETIMSGKIDDGTKASRIYRYMDWQDGVLHGIRLAHFGKDIDYQEQTDPLKQAQNEYYEMLSEINTPEKQALLTDDQLEKIKTDFLNRLAPKERDYIIANKSNFMVPPSIYNLIKPDHQQAIGNEKTKASLRQARKARGEAVPDSLKESPINELAIKYYAVARGVIESNLARGRLTKDRVLLPPAQEQIEISRSLLER